MAPLPVIKHGFGGSRLFDSVYWADRLVLVHDPAIVVMFSGTNDIAGTNPKSPTEVSQLFLQFVGRLRNGRCTAPIVYIAISPTRARIKHLDRVLETNLQIAAICEKDSALHFVDTASLLLDVTGRPNPRWFAKDKLHLNADGYALWTKHIRPLVDVLFAADQSR